MANGGHARLSASSAERFMECPGSVALCELMPDEESAFAAEGTAAHALAERCLREGVEAWTLTGAELPGGYTATPEMCRQVQVYLDYVVECVADGGELHVEMRLEDEGLGGDMGGTADAVVNRLVEPDKAGNCGRIEIIDLKYGAGVPVTVEGNAQLRYYAFLVLRQLGVSPDMDCSVKIAIVQPRCEHPDGPVRWEWMSSKNLFKWAEEELLPAVDRVRNGEQEYKAGEHCRFCSAKLICPAMKENFNAMAAPQKQTPEEFDDNTLAGYFESIKTVEMFIRAVKAECMKRALAGSPVAGTKLIEGRSNREWNEEAEEAIVLLLGEDAYNPPTLKSPSQIEKLPGGKDLAARYAFKPRGKPTLVSSDAKGVPYDPQAAGEAFASIDYTPGAE